MLQMKTTHLIVFKLDKNLLDKDIDGENCFEAFVKIFVSLHE